MSQTDPHAALRRKLKRCNLCELERRSGIPARTLRRIKNGTGDVQQTTIDRIEPHMADSPRLSPEERAAVAANTRALKRATS